MSESIIDQKALAPAEEGTQWVELASRRNDKLLATLHTLGGEALAETLSLVIVEHDNGVSLTQEGPLQEVAQIYKHPMIYVSPEDARRAYPPAA
jgi:hypothetical protein